LLSHDSHAADPAGPPPTIQYHRTRSSYNQRRPAANGQITRSDPRTQGFSDRSCGCSWIVLITCGFGDCRRSLSAVIFGYLAGFVTVKRPYNQRSACAPMILHAGAVWRPVDLAQPDHTPARGQPSTAPPRAAYGSAPGLACGSPPEVEGMPHPAL
jgi:hypothetical protein